VAVSEEKPISANLWFHLPVMAGGIACCAYFHFHPPSSGTPLDALAFFAGVMMLWEMRGWQKGVYFALILFLVIAEYRAENNDRITAAKDQAAAAETAECDRLDQNSQFQNIADGIHQAITTSNHQFGVTLGANKNAQHQEQADFKALVQKETDLFNSQEKELELEASTQEELDATFETVLASARAGSAANSAEIARVQATALPTFQNSLTAAPLTPGETKELQIKGLQMAKEINDWIALVSKDVPKPAPVSPGGGWNPAAEAADEKASEAYARTLESEWTAKFDGGPRLLLHQLHNDQGVLLTCTGNAAGGGPTNFLGLCKACADRIEQGSMRLQY
jgi:hypothetical protein